MLGIALVGIMIPALVVSAGGHEGDNRNEAAVLLPPTAAALKGCGLCETQSAGLTATAEPTETVASADPPTGAPADATEEPAPAITYPTLEVRPGDTLLALAEWYEVTPWDIAVASGRAVDDFLQIGEVLTIPVDYSVFSVPPDPSVAVAAVPAEAEEPGPIVAAVPQATPVPAPVVTPKPYVPPPARADIVAIICSFAWPCDAMVRIAACESGLNPAAVNPVGYYGLFQIAGSFPGWDDPYTNALVAYEQKYLPSLARGNGLAPWPVCQYY